MLLRNFECIYQYYQNLLWVYIFQQIFLKFTNFMMEFQKVKRYIKITVQSGMYQTKFLLKWNKTDKISVYSTKHLNIFEYLDILFQSHIHN